MREKERMLLTLPIDGRMTPSRRKLAQNNISERDNEKKAGKRDTERDIVRMLLTLPMDGRMTPSRRKLTQNNTS